MPRSSWIIAATLGLIAASLQAQEQADAANQRTQDQQNFTEEYIFGIPVRIIEDDVSAQDRRRREREVEQREKDDLTAQQGMNVATQAMNEATQSMKWAAWVSTFFVALGTGLLVWTLRLTREANRAAQQAVAVTRDIGEAQLRAYVDLGRFNWVSHWKFEDKEQIFWRFTFEISNTGATPTKRLQVRAYLIQSQTLMEDFAIPEEIDRMPLTLGAGRSAGVLNFDIDAPTLEKVANGDDKIYVLIEATYGNAINPSSQHITRIGMQFAEITGDPKKYWHATDNPVFVKFKHISGFNCSDDECGDQ